MKLCDTYHINLKRHILLILIKKIQNNIDHYFEYKSYNSIMLFIIWSSDESDSLGYIGKETIDSNNKFVLG